MLSNHILYVYIILIVEKKAFPGYAVAIIVSVVVLIVIGAFICFKCYQRHFGYDKGNSLELSEHIKLIYFSFLHLKKCNQFGNNITTCENQALAEYSTESET